MFQCPWSRLLAERIQCRQITLGFRQPGLSKHASVTNSSEPTSRCSAIPSSASLSHPNEFPKSNTRKRDKQTVRWYHSGPYAGGALGNV